MQHLDLETLGFLLFITINDLSGLGPLIPIASMHQMFQNSLTLLSDSPYA